MMELAFRHIEINSNFYFSQYWDGEISQNFIFSIVQKIIFQTIILNEINFFLIIIYTLI